MISIDSRIPVNWTSDHTPVSYNVCLRDDMGLESPPLRIMSWNKMNKCHSRSTCSDQWAPYSNNPWDIDETDEESEARFKLQYDFLLSEIDQRLRGNSPLDVIALQEANDLVFGRSANKNAFIDELKKRCWSLKTTQKKDQSKPMVILYNSERLKYVEQSGNLPSPSGKNCLFEVRFKDKNDQNRIIAICNAHLDFSYDYRRELVQYQVNQVAKEIFTVIIGDTNYPNEDQMSFVSNCHFPTNIDVDESGKLITYFHQGTKHVKKYDSLAASPTSHTSVKIQEDRLTFFHKTGVNSFRVETVDPIGEWNLDTCHVSLKGLPWVKNEYLVSVADVDLRDLREAEKLASGIKKGLLPYMKNHVVVTEDSSRKVVYFRFEDETAAQTFESLLNDRSRKTLVVSSILETYKEKPWHKLSVYKRDVHHVYQTYLVPYKQRYVLDTN